MNQSQPCLEGALCQTARSPHTHWPGHARICTTCPVLTENPEEATQYQLRLGWGQPPRGETAELVFKGEGGAGSEGLPGGERLEQRPRGRSVPLGRGECSREEREPAELGQGRA